MRRIILCLFGALAIAVSGVARAEPLDLRWQVDPAERELLSGKTVDTDGAAIMCRNKQDIDDIMWLDLKGAVMQLAKKNQKYQCVIAGKGTKFRYLGIVGWGKVGKIFYCEYNVQIVRTNTRWLDKRYTYTLRATSSPFLQRECQNSESL